MENKIMKKKRFFPVWLDDTEKEWLGTMSKDGWHLVQKGFLTYWFEKGAPKEYIYSFDYKPPQDKDFNDYLRILGENGWQRVGEFANWHYFRHEFVPGLSDIYNNAEAKAKQLKRLMIILIFLAVANAVIIANNVFFLSIVSDTLSDIPVYILVLWAIMFIVILLLAYGAVSIAKKLRQIKKSLVK